MGRREIAGLLNVNRQCHQYSRGKEMTGKKNRGNFKIKFLLPERNWKTIYTKNSTTGKVREMTVRRYAKYLAKKKHKTY